MKLKTHPNNNRNLKIIYHLPERVYKRLCWKAKQWLNFWGMMGGGGERGRGEGDKYFIMNRPNRVLKNTICHIFHSTGEM